jgi:hypothetical protein
MNWNADDDMERQVLKRIAAMLVALAALADCSCSRSSLVRRLVLWFLRRGESVARDFVAEEAEARGLAMPDLPAPMSTGDSVADAMLLAAVFRALALILQCLPARPLDDRQWTLCDLSPS